MGGSRPRDEDISRIVNSVRQIQGTLDRYSKTLNRSFRITGQQLGLLRVVRLYPAITLGRVSERMYLHISTVSGIADRLEARGYLKRIRSAEDRRLVHLRLTPKGVRTTEQAPPSGFGLMVRNLEKLPAAELRRMAWSMQRLTRLMGHQAGPRGPASDSAEFSG
jgi:DNA-binding MarR family transcriptional regulator